MEQKITSTIRLRMSSQDAHYGGNLVDGAHMLALFGDVATELLIKCDGDEGLFKAYDMVEFIAPVYAGDYIEAYGEITHIGNSSRKMSFEARNAKIPPADTESFRAANGFGELRRHGSFEPDEGGFFCSHFQRRAA